MESDFFDLIGGSPQGIWNGQNCYIASSYDNASFVNQEDRFKYCDDLNILELLFIGKILTEYNFYEHVASDVAIGQLFLPAGATNTPENLHSISAWTNTNLAKLNEEKTNYTVFTRAQTECSTRLFPNGKVLKRKKCTKLLGVWLQEDGGWDKNTKETCKAAYQRISMLTKLRYAGETI